MTLTCIHFDRVTETGKKYIFIIIFKPTLYIEIRDYTMLQQSRQIVKCLFYTTTPVKGISFNLILCFKGRWENSSGQLMPWLRCKEILKVAVFPCWFSVFTYTVFTLFLFSISNGKCICFVQQELAFVKADFLHYLIPLASPAVR